MVLIETREKDNLVVFDWINAQVLYVREFFFVFSAHKELKELYRMPTLRLSAR